MQFPPDEFVHTALAAADAARRVTREYFRAGLAVTSKEDRSPVTAADHQTEHCIRELILARHPAHGFLGEETGAAGNAHRGEWCWVIDPIDGTKSFATGNPTFGTLIALLHRDRPVLGIIDHAALNERWIGINGQQTTHNGAPCTTSTARRLADGTLYATTPDMFGADTLERFNHLSGAFRFRVFGGDCYCYGLLASGFTEAVCETQMNPHDYLALVPVIEGAGGIITDWRGERLTLASGRQAPASDGQAPASDGQVLATANDALHQAALARLNENQ